MENLLSIPNSVLFGNMRPWLNANQDEEKFKHLLNFDLRSNKDNPVAFFNQLISAFEKVNFKTESENIEEIKILAQIKVEQNLSDKIISIDLPAFFNKQSEFYFYFLKNEAKGILLAMSSCAKGNDEIEIKYQLYYLFQKLEELFNQVQEISASSKVDFFVIDTLKLCLFNLYVELYQQYHKYINFEVLSKNEVLFMICPEFELSKSDKTKIAYFIDQYLVTYQENINSELPEVSKEAESRETTEALNEIVFTPRQSDFRGTGKSPVRYSDIRNIGLFTKFEQELFDSKIINEEYEFQKKRGNKEMLAALYQILIQKNYFRKRNSRNGRDFEPSHYRQYLDHRYDVDTSQQFRKCKAEDIESLKYKNHWIENIEYCR